MAGKSKLFKLDRDENEALQKVHLASGIPDGQFIRRPKEWQQITNRFISQTGCSVTKEDVLKYIQNERKCGRWFKFDGSHKRLPQTDMSIFSDEQWLAIETVYKRIGIYSDEYQTDKRGAARLHREVVAVIGPTVGILKLVDALIARRKLGLLPHLPKQNLGFGDIGQVDFG